MLERKDNHVSESLKLLLTQLKQASKLQAFSASFATQIQELENELFKLLLERSIDTGIGAQLDAIGTIVNVERGGLSDVDYRARLRVQILANASSGTIEDILALVDKLTQARIAITEGAIAEFQLELVSPQLLADHVTIARFVRLIRAASVYVHVIAPNSDVGGEEYFSFGPANDIYGDNYGFDDGAFVNAIEA